MKKAVKGFIFLKLFLAFLFINQGMSMEKKNFFDYQVQTLTGQEVKLSDYRGKVILAVNTASKCGFTGQYEDLEKIYQQYKDQGLVVLAFPSNDFGNQEPGSNEEIKNFCQRNYGVSFPVFEKKPVKGEQKQEIFKFLTTDHPKHTGEIKWNFEKFLINKQGHVFDRFYSFTNPKAKRLTKKIEQLLNE